MTRVLFLTESYHPVLGGGEQHIRALAAGLAGRGIPCTVVTRRGDPGWPADERDGETRVVRVAPPGPARTGKYLMVLPALGALFRERRTFDVLVVRGTRVLGLPALMMGRLLQKPVVLQAEVNGEMSGEVYTWGTRLDRQPWRALVHAAVWIRNLFLRRADAFVAMSRLIRDETAAAGVDRERIVHLPHGIDLARFRPATPPEKQSLRRALGLAADAIVLTYTGRLLRGKGLETLVDAFASIAARHPLLRLVIVGDGAGQALSVEREIRDDVHARTLDGRVTFTGRVEAVEDWLRASDLFVFPSVFEALGLSLIEAAACGLPCVATRTGGIVDVIEHEQTGLLVPPSDPPALATAVERLLADPATAEAMGQAGARVARDRFDAAASVEKYRALFAELHRSGAPTTAAPR